jgi:ankyrin repeat protein
MNINTILFEPNAKYTAVGKMNMGDFLAGGSTTNLRIRLETDKQGRVIRFDDGFAKDLGMADTWDYLKLQNEATGMVFDLRLHTAAANGDLALHWASAHGHVDVANLLVSSQADVNSIDDMGWTPIFLAAQNGHQRIAVFLHENGAKLETTINGEKHRLSIGKDWNEALLEAAESGNLRAAKEALDNGADVNCTTADGWSALLCATKSDPAIAELLVANGADPNLASNRGYTPLMRAAGNGKMATVKILLAAGADVAMRDCDDKTAAQLALEMKQFECAELVRKGHSMTTSSQEESGSGKDGQKVKVELDEAQLIMLELTRGVVGGVVRFVDVTFTDGIKCRCACLGGRAIEIPRKYSANDVKSVGVPFDQSSPADAV